MPKMEAIVEQESAFESSSIMMSQGPVANSNYSRQTKFRYVPKDENDLERAVESESSDDEIDDQMEKDIIEQINKQFLAKSQNSHEVSQSL